MINNIVDKLMELLPKSTRKEHTIPIGFTPPLSSDGHVDSFRITFDEHNEEWDACYDNELSWFDVQPAFMDNALTESEWVMAVATEYLNQIESDDNRWDDYNRDGFIHIVQKYTNEMPR